MKIINEIVNYCGVDRILHFLVGMLIVSQFEFMYTEFMWGPIIGVVIVAVLSLIKEFVFDDKVDFVDFWFSLIGGMVQVFILIIKSNLFYIPW